MTPKQQKRKPRRKRQTLRIQTNYPHPTIELREFVIERGSAPDLLRIIDYGIDPETDCRFILDIKEAKIKYIKHILDTEYNLLVTLDLTPHLSMSDLEDKVESQRHRELLDILVGDVAMKKASEVNNSGTSAQIKYLEGNGVTPEQLAAYLGVNQNANLV